jgi:hypothetical protein
MLDRLVHRIEGDEQSSYNSSCPLCGCNQFVNVHQHVLEVLDAHCMPRSWATHAGVDEASPSRSASRVAVPLASAQEEPALPYFGCPSSVGSSWLDSAVEQAPAEAGKGGLHVTSRNTPEMSSLFSGTCTFVDDQTDLDARRSVDSAALHASGCRSRIAGGCWSGANAGMVQHGAWKGSMPMPTVLTGHGAAILNMAQDSTGNLYTSSSDKTIKVPLPPVCNVCYRGDHF